MAKITTAQKFEALKKSVTEYVALVQNRKGVAHSTTPQLLNDRPNVVSISELITITETASALGKHVVLEVSGPATKPSEKTLTLMIVDKYPSIPVGLLYPEII